VNEIKIVVTGTDKSGPAFAAAEKGAKELTDAVEKIPGVTPALTGLGKEADKAGDELKGAAVDANFLAEELRKARRDALELKAALRAGGDQTVLDEYKKKTRELAELEKVAKAVGLGGDGVVGQGSQVGAKTGQAIVKGVKSTAGGPSGIWEAVGSVLTNPVGLAATVAAAVLIGGEIGGVIGGAVTAGIGIGGIGAGVAASLNDPKVKAAEQGLKASFTDLAAGIGDDFATSTSSALHILRAELDHLHPSIRSTLKELAPMTTVLAQGAATGMDVFWQHLSKALLNSKPLIEWTAREIPKLADQVGGLIEAMSEHTDEAEFALDSLFGIIKFGIGALEAFTTVGAATIGVIEKIQEAGSKIPVVGDALSRAHGQLDTMATSSAYAAKTAEQLAEEQKALATALDAATAAFERQISDMLAADNVAINYQQAIDDLTASVHENGRSLDINTQQGRNNKRTLDQLIGTIEATYEANLKSGMGAQKASLAFLAQEGALQRQMKALGFSKDEIDKYIKALEAMRLAAISANNAINDTGLGHTHHDSYAQGGYRRAAAAGMFVPPSSPGTTLIGEPQTGGEWLIPARGISRDRAAGLIRGAARGYGLDVGQAGRATPVAMAAPAPTMSGEVRTTVEFAGDVDSAVATLIQRLIRERKITIVSSAIVTGS